MKSIIIDQPAGLGDILFCQKLVQELAKDYKSKFPYTDYAIFWPVCDEYLKSTIKHIYSPGVHFISPEVAKKFNILETVSLRTADQYFSGCMMDAKYKLCNKSYKNWHRYIHLQRDFHREQQLMDILGINVSSIYTLVNRNFGTFPHSQVCKHIPTDIEGDVIELRPIHGFNIFDWCGVICNAESIHTVDTSIMFLIEILKVEATQNLFCYSRFDPPDFRNVSHLFGQPWKYVS